ncbi:MAG: histidine phosphatase family protein [Akkermansia sp.]
MNSDAQSIELTLIRHGQTIENTQNRCQGHTVGTLSPLGISQAQTLTTVMQPEVFDAVFASDLTRAIETGRIIFPTVPIVQDQRLRERFYGALEGEVLPEGLRFDGEIEGAETLDALRLRLQDFVCELRAKHAGQKIAIVTHGIVIKTLLSLFTEQPFADIRIPKNCTPYTLKL